MDFQCGACGRGYMHKKTLLRHQRLECGKEPSLPCPYCPHRTKYRSSLLTHVTNRHGDMLSALAGSGSGAQDLT